VNCEGNAQPAAHGNKKNAVAKKGRGAKRGSLFGKKGCIQRWGDARGKGILEDRLIIFYAHRYRTELAGASRLGSTRGGAC